MSKNNSDLTIRDPIHGMITFPKDSLVKKLIDTKEFQRLRRIKQLGFSDFTYPGATHTRFSHSIGVAWLVSKAVRKLFEKGQIKLSDFISKEQDKNKQYKDEEQIIDIMSCAGLLHDIGHGPFSHTFSKICPGFDHEDTSTKVINEKTAISKILDDGVKSKEYPITIKDDISELITGVTPFDSKILSKEPKKNGKVSKLYIISSLIKSQLDCDRLDYLLRDTYFCGTPVYVDIDFMFRSMLVKSVPMLSIFGLKPEERLRIVYEKKCIPTIEQFLLSRVFHYKNIAYHKTTRSVEVLYESIIKKIPEFKPTNNSNKYSELIKKEDEDFDLNWFLNQSDSSVISKIEGSADLIDEADQFLSRDLLKQISFENLNENQIKKVFSRFKPLTDTPEEKDLYKFNKESYNEVKTLIKYGCALKEDEKKFELMKKVKELILVFDPNFDKSDEIQDISEFSEIARKLTGVKPETKYYVSKEDRDKIEEMTSTEDSNGDNANK